MTYGSSNSRGFHVSFQGRAFLTLWPDFCFLPSTKYGTPQGSGWVLSIMPGSGFRAIITACGLHIDTCFSLPLSSPRRAPYSALSHHSPYSLCAVASCLVRMVGLHRTHYPEALLNILPLLLALNKFSLTLTPDYRMSFDGIYATQRGDQRQSCQGGTGYMWLAGLAVPSKALCRFPQKGSGVSASSYPQPHHCASYRS